MHPFLPEPADLAPFPRPIRVALVGAGSAARMIARHLRTPVPGIHLAAISNRTPAHALAAWGGADVSLAESAEAVEELVNAGRPCIATNPLHVVTAPSIDVVVEATGTVEFAAGTVLAALGHRKHVVLVNAELDATLGPILKHHADRAGVILTNTDGDEPGVAMTLLRYLRSVGLHPVAAGNLKGLIDRTRTPDTQREFAARHGLDPRAVTSFADGTKLAMEAAVLANATGFAIGRRGMFGPVCGHVNELAQLLPLGLMLERGLVDFALGASPHSGAFVLTYEDDPEKRRELAYFKLGDGPVYTFYTPYHLPHIQVVASIRAAMRGEATVAPRGGPVAEVAAVAKTDLRPGDSLDGPGGYLTYGIVDNAAAFATGDLLPMGVSQDCIVRRPVPRDQPLTYADVALPAGRLCDRLRSDQARHFAPRSTRRPAVTLLPSDSPAAPRPAEPHIIHSPS